MSEQVIIDLIQKMHARIDALAATNGHEFNSIREDVFTATQVLADAIGNITQSTEAIKESIRLVTTESCESVKEHLQACCKEANYRLKVIANLNAARVISPEQQELLERLQSIREMGADLREEIQKTLCALKEVADQSSDESKALNAKLERQAEGAQAYERLLKSQIEKIAEATMH